MPTKGLKVYGAAREHILGRIKAVLQSDERVAGAWLSGSVGRGEGDLWADCDLVVVVEDESWDWFLDTRPTLYASVGQVSLLQDVIPGQRNTGQNFNLVIFAGGVEVDWTFQRASLAHKPIGHQVLFEHRPFPVVATPALSQEERRQLARQWALFFWAMAPIAVKYCGRGDTRRAASQVTLLSRGLISLWRILEQPEGPDPWQPDTNRPLEDEFNERLPQLGRVVSPGRVLAVIKALCEEAEKLQKPLTDLAAEVNPRIIEDTASLVGVADSEIRRGRYQALKHR